MKQLRRACLRWCAAALLAFIAFGAGAAPVQASSACEVPVDIPTARRTITDAAPALAGPADAALPDWLALEVRGEQHRITYDIDVSACAQASAAALWLFRVGAPYRITVDGQPLELLSARAPLRPELLLGELLQAQPQTHNGRIPALFALPRGAQRVRVALQTLTYLPYGIVEARLGPTNLLLPVQARSLETVVAYGDAAAGVVLVLGLMAFLLWLPRRGDFGLLWLAIACGLWGLRGLAYFSHAVYMRPLAFEQFNPLNVLLTSGALAASIACLLGAMTRRRALTLALAAALCVAALLVAGLLERGSGPARAVTLLTSFSMVAWPGLLVWQHRASLARWQVATLSGGLLLLLFCAVHDLMVVAGTLGPHSASYVFWGFVLLLIAFAAMSGQYVVMTLNRAERSNEELELHVARKSSELESSYARLRETEQESARAQERARLLRDMHDGLGAQLMTALRGVERGALSPGDIARSLQDGLDELRLLMDSTDMGQYLPGALAAWRNRWDARLAAAGVSLHWHVAESLDQVHLSGETALQVMRILQEAATNIVKHAQAKNMELDARVAGGGAGAAELRIAITDDGVGLSGDAVRAGARGMKNMHYRAGEIGARLTVRARNPPDAGTAVLLELPLPLSPSPSPSPSP